MFCLVGVILAGFWLSGCKKSAEPAAEAPPLQAINATEFRPAFASASTEIKTSVDRVMMDIQGSFYTDAQNELAKLAANPAINESQKKVVGDLAEQVKRKMAAIAGPPK
jgi:hypothetical protein